MEARIVELGGVGWHSPRRSKVALVKRYGDQPWEELVTTTLTLEEAESVCKSLIRLLMQGEVKK